MFISKSSCLGGVGEGETESCLSCSFLGSTRLRPGPFAWAGCSAVGLPGGGVLYCHWEGSFFKDRPCLREKKWRLGTLLFGGGWPLLPACVKCCSMGLGYPLTIPSLSCCNWAPWGQAWCTVRGRPVENRFLKMKESWPHTEGCNLFKVNIMMIHCSKMTN